MRTLGPVDDLIGELIDDELLDWVREQAPHEAIEADDFSSVTSWIQVFGSGGGPFVRRGMVSTAAMSAWRITAIESPQMTVVIAGDRLYNCFPTDSGLLAKLKAGDWSCLEPGTRTAGART